MPEVRLQAADCARLYMLHSKPQGAARDSKLELEPKAKLSALYVVDTVKNYCIVVLAGPA